MTIGNRSVSRDRQIGHKFTRQTICICQWFLKANKIRGSIRKLNQVPIDKLKPNNVLCAMEYDELIDMLPAINIKFADIRNPLNSLTAIGAHKRQLFNEFHW